jgi:hypothetical protein
MTSSYLLFSTHLTTSLSAYMIAIIYPIITHIACSFKIPHSTHPYNAVNLLIYSLSCQYFASISSTILKMITWVTHSLQKNHYFESSTLYSMFDINRVTSLLKLSHQYNALIYLHKFESSYPLFYCFIFIRIITVLLTILILLTFLNYSYLFL